MRPQARCLPAMQLLLVPLLLAVRGAGRGRRHTAITISFMRDYKTTDWVYSVLSPEYWRVQSAHAHPQQLRAATARYVRPPYHNLYQGVRRSTDRRMYMKKFNFAPKATGHSVFCQAILPCKISHVAVETQAGAPVVLRGGAGQSFFKVLVKAGAGDALRGVLNVYCRAPRG